MTRQGTPPSGLTRGREGLGDDFLRFCRARNLDSTFAIKIQNCRPRSGFIIEQFRQTLRPAARKDRIRETAGSGRT